MRFRRLCWAWHSERAVPLMVSGSALLWARSARPHQARRLLTATSTDGDPNAFVAFGHDVVREGYEIMGDEQLCFSTSYGLYDGHKTYLRLDLGRRYRSTCDLRPGHELLPLYPGV